MKQANRALVLALALGAVVLLGGCERPPPRSVQQGYRGTGMVAIINKRTEAALLAKNVMPPAQPAAEGDAPLAKDVYQNVQVLTDLNVTEFVRQMTNQANWVAPTQQCEYCHNLNNFASDEKYTKVVARRMLQMTRDININWQKHILQTGVTCYTCHRGNPVPQYVWFEQPAPRSAPGMAGYRAGQNIAAMRVGLTSLPYDPFTPYLVNAEPIRVVSSTALPAGNEASIKQAEQTYGLMMHISRALGVNCTHCHATQQFGLWDGAPPQRVQGWYAIRMVRMANNTYMLPLKGVLPASRMGPLGDVPKIYCTTCHQGQPKPLNGASMMAVAPELMRIKPPPAPPAPPADGAAPDAAAPLAAPAAAAPVAGAT
jgi:photosynthetic reaction center cytochrome c subunit